MPAVPLSPHKRYSALDGLQIAFLPVVAAATDIPTRAEINAGTDVSTEVDGLGEGWDVQPESIKMPGLVRFEGSLPGKLTVEDSTLNFYASSDGDDITDVLPDGTSGYIVIFPNGDKPAARMNIWPVRVNRLTELHSTENASLHRVTFSHLRLPKERVPVPASP